MCILIYFKTQSDQPRITWNALKSQIFDLFTKSSSVHKWNFIYVFYRTGTTQCLLNNY